MAARAVTVSANAMLPATIRWGARGSSSQATMLTTLSARSPLADARNSSTEAEREQGEPIPGRRLDPFRDRVNDRGGQPGLLTQRLHRAIDAVHQEPQRRDQDQRERQGPHEESERDPSGQQPTGATPISIVRVQQDVHPMRRSPSWRILTSACRRASAARSRASRARSRSFRPAPSLLRSSATARR